jgi:hypothetical protein
MSDDEVVSTETVEDLVWGLVRICFAWWPMMIVAGILHHELDRRIPSLSFVQAEALAVALTLFAWFFRR